MAYYCRDCSYRGSKSGQVGECLGCGSHNITQDLKVIKKKGRPGGWRLVLLLLLWGYLIAEVLSKLSQ